MKGILFKPDIIKAIREGRKTVTRRLSGKGLEIVNANPAEWWLAKDFPQGMVYRNTTQFQWDTGGKMCTVNARYHVGEVVYIKEAFIYSFGRYPDIFWIQYCSDGAKIEQHISFRFPWGKAARQCYTKLDGSPNRVSPLFMPAWAARDFIKITDVRAERLQEITNKDAEAEGVDSYSADNWQTEEFRGNYAELWDSINPDYTWESNPWVFRYQFEKEIPA